MQHHCNTPQARDMSPLLAAKGTQMRSAEKIYKAAEQPTHGFKFQTQASSALQRRPPTAHCQTTVLLLQAAVAIDNQLFVGQAEKRKHRTGWVEVYLATRRSFTAQSIPNPYLVYTLRGRSIQGYGGRAISGCITHNHTIPPVPSVRWSYIYSSTQTITSK